MKKILFLFLLIPFYWHTLEAQCLELVWSDEFNRSGAPDPANWSYDLGTGNSGWGNNEVQVYTQESANVRVSDGKLIIDALKASNGTWTSARIKTQGKHRFRYGRIEFRAKLPAGSGTWPALWMLGEDFATEGWPACGEIDVMEHVGRDPGRIHGSLHTPSSYGNTVNTGSKVIGDFATAFHDYAVEWTEEKITFLIDNVPFYIYQPAVKDAATWPFDDDFFIIMNIAMGGNFGSAPQYETGGLRNGIDPNLSSARMEVDYVRVYQELTGELRIEGDSIILPGTQGAVFAVPDLVGGTFNWTVPAGGTIVSGQGTNAIRVNWGDTEGEVIVDITGNCGEYRLSLPVKGVAVPSGASYVLDDFEDNDAGRWVSEAGAGNTFTLEESNGELRIEYDVSDPAKNPRLKFTLPQPVDLSSYTKLRVRAKTQNTSGTVNMRIDLFDLNGTATNATPVFRLEPLIDNGEYATYTFDFAGNWGSSAPVAGAQVDATRINGLYLYIDYGIFGSPGQDVIWLDIINAVNPQTTDLAELLTTAGLRIFPNPAGDHISVLWEKKLPAGPPIQIDLLNALGQPVSRPTGIAGASRFDFQVGDLPAGLYFVRVQMGLEAILHKVMIFRSAAN